MTLTAPTLNLDMLGATAKCRRCPNPAEYRIRANCCPAECLTCAACETHLNTKWAATVALTGGLVCSHCRHTTHNVQDAVTTHLI